MTDPILIDIRYGYTSVFEEHPVTFYLQFLPEYMREEVNCYKFPNDQKLRLLAKLILEQRLQEDNKQNLFTSFTRDHAGKPFISEWKNFSISHSGTLAVFADAVEPVGIDLELIADLDIGEFTVELHQNEKEAVLTSTQPLLTFYEIWTKKEAFLKCLGIGIAKGLSQYDCHSDRIKCQGETWFFHKITLFENFICYLSTRHKVVEILATEFKRSDLPCLI